MSSHIAMIALLVRDYDEAIAWYRDALGFALLEDDDRGGDGVAKNRQPLRVVTTKLRQTGIDANHCEKDTN